MVVIGSTGFMGQALIAELLARGHPVTALTRIGSEHKVPVGARVVGCNPLDHLSYLSEVAPGQTIVQLAGVSHPNPLKKDQFEKIDYVAGRESVSAAKRVGAKQLVYVSVAQPAPIMKTYVQARAAVEKLIEENNLNATILRPWYVIGPGRRWPLFLLPLYWIFENQSATRASALRLGFVSVEEMVRAMVSAVEDPPAGRRVWDVPAIREKGTLPV